MSAPVGRREFFALEAGEYLERLALLVGATDPPAAEDLVRHARALRGAALMAGPPGFSTAAAAIETAVKGVRDGVLEWSPELAERLAHAIEDCKALLRKVREWSETDTQRCDRIAEQLDLDSGSRERHTGSRIVSGTGLTAGVRTYVAREAAAVAGTLDQVAPMVDRKPGPESAELLLQRLQPLRGLGALPGLSPLPELLETLDLAIATAGQGRAWSPLAGKALRGAGAALARMARDIAELGIPQHDSTEVVQAAELLRDAFLLEDDVVEIATLFAVGDDAPVRSRGTPAVPRVAAGDSAIELVSLADRLRQAAEQTRGHVPRSARTLQLQGLVLALRGLSLTPAVRAGAGELFRAIDREAMSGRALLQADAFAVLLRDAADRLATAADAGGTAALPELLLPLVQRLDEMRGTDGAEAVDVMPIEALAPEIDNDTDVVPIESLLYEGAAAVAPRFLPFERTFTTYFRLLSEETAATDGPIVPIASLAPEPVADLVPIEMLLYRGRRALERADLVRRELDAALRIRRDVRGVEPLLAELLDLVPLALDDER
jgi:HPt (histidine-containing phosphotransfer) domain-containing protein